MVASWFVCGSKVTFKVSKSSSERWSIFKDRIINTKKYYLDWMVKKVKKYLKDILSCLY